MAPWPTDSANPNLWIPCSCQKRCYCCIDGRVHLELGFVRRIVEVLADECDEIAREFLGVLGGSRVLVLRFIGTLRLNVHYNLYARNWVGLSKEYGRWDDREINHSICIKEYVY